MADTNDRKARAIAPQDIAAAQDPDALLTVHTVAQLTGFAEKTIRERTREGRFPASVHVGHFVRWKASDVRAWLQQQAAA